MNILSSSIAVDVLKSLAAESATGLELMSPQDSGMGLDSHSLVNGLRPWVRQFKHITGELMLTFQYLGLYCKMVIRARLESWQVFLPIIFLSSALVPFFFLGTG